MQNKKIVEKTGLYFIGNFSSKILTALLVPIYAFYISSKDLGTYDYSQTIMNIVIPIVFVSIWEAIIRFILGEKDKKDQNKKLATSAFFTVSMCLFFIIITLIVSRFIEIEYLYYFIIMCCFTALAQIWQYYARALERNKLYVVTSIISTVVNLSLNLLLILVLHLKIESLYISYILSNVVTFLILEIKIKIFKLVKPKNISSKILKKMIWYSAPLVVNSIAVWIINGLGKVIIFQNLGASSNGIYTFANKFVTIVTTVGNIVTMAILEEAMISLSDNDFKDSYPKLLQQVFRIFLSLIIVVIPVIAIFYEFIDTTEYYESLYILPFLLIYSVMTTMSTNFGVIFKTVNKNKYQVITTIISSAFMILISYLLLNTCGIYGVAIGQMASALIMVLSRYWMSRKFMEYRLNWWPIIILILGYIVVSIASIFTSIVLKIVILLIVIIIIGYINKDFLSELIKIGTGYFHRK